MRTLTLLFTAVLLAGCLPPEYPEMTDTWEQLPDTLITNDMSNLIIKLDSTEDIRNNLYSLDYQGTNKFLATPIPINKAGLATLIDDYKDLVNATKNYLAAKSALRNALAVNPDLSAGDKAVNNILEASNALNQLLNKLIS